MKDETKTIFVGEKIDIIVKKLVEAKYILGDDKLQRRRLTLAQMRLNRLIDDLKDETAHIVYISGTPDKIKAEFDTINH